MWNDFLFPLGGDGTYWLVKIMNFSEIWNFENWKWEMDRGQGECGSPFLFSIMLWFLSQLVTSLCDSPGAS